MEKSELKISGGTSLRGNGCWYVRRHYVTAAGMRGSDLLGGPFRTIEAAEKRLAKAEKELAKQTK